jgi:hypothetical protein
VGESLKNVHVGGVYAGHGECFNASAIGDAPLSGSDRVIECSRPTLLPVKDGGEGLSSLNDPREKCAVKKSSYTEQHIALMAPAG